MTPLEMIVEWRKGCSCAPTDHPEQCHECTGALIGALERALTKQQSSSLLLLQRVAAEAWRLAAQGVADQISPEIPEGTAELIVQMKTDMATEYGWLVENGKPGDELRYRTWRDGMPAWTADYNEATRYCRRIDAERAHREDEDAWRIVQHAWDDMPANAPAKGQAAPQNNERGLRQ